VYFNFIKKLRQYKTYNIKILKLTFFKFYIGVSLDNREWIISNQNIIVEGKKNNFCNRIRPRARVILMIMMMKKPNCCLSQAAAAVTVG
jgi:hypothetical protein